MDAISNKTSKENMRYLTHSIIGIIIMFGFGFIPPIAPITELGMKILGIFLGLIYLWSMVDMLWPSLLGVFAFAFSGYASMAEILKLTYGNETVWICLFSLAFLGVIESAGINEHIVIFLLSRKVINGRPWMFTLIWFIACFVLAVLIGNLPATLLLWSIFNEVASKLNLPKGDRFAAFMIIGVPTICGFSSCLLPFRGLPLLLLGTLKSMSGISVAYLNYMCVSFPIIIVSIFAYIGMMRFVLRIDVSAFKNINMDLFKKDIPPMSKMQKFLLGYLIFFLIMLSIPGLLPKGSWVGLKMTALGTSGIMIFLFVLLCIIRLDDKPLVNFQKLAGVHIMWSMVFLIATALALATILVADETGIKPFLINILTVIFAGKGQMVFLVILTAIALILTNFCNNMVTAFMLVPLAVAYGAQFTINLPGAVTLICFAVLPAFLIPAASPFAAMVFSHPLIDKGKNFGNTLIVVILCYLVLISVGIPLSMLVY